ncbi:MAG: hypothetical protein ACOX4Q_08630 [Syntrophomonadales bacterium]|jgi:hypothetical protein
MDYSHLARMTCDHGIIQFAPYGEPDPGSGCTTDDNARAFLVALGMEGPEREKYAQHYCDVLYKAWKKGEGWSNWWLPGRGYIPDLDSEDSLGRAFWASCMGTVADLPGVSEACREMAFDSLTIMEGLSYPRSKAYALIGCAALISSPSVQDQRIVNIIGQCVDQLTSLYRRNNSAGWRWFEDSMTYCNAVLPQALFTYCRARIDRQVQGMARDTLLFLGDNVLARGYFNPVGNRGWWPKGKPMPLFDQQPVEGCSMIMACREAFIVTGQKDFRDMAQMALAWYQGKNVHNLTLYDPETGGCYDGLTPTGLNQNQGGEALISLLLANQIMNGEPFVNHSLS